MTRNRRIPTAALWAPLLTASLLALGCHAAPTAAEQQLAQPSNAPLATSAHATASLPAELQGQWEPFSRALQTSGPLNVHAQGITWKPCGSAAHAIQLENDPAQQGQLLALVGEPTCLLDSKPISHLRLQAQGACKLSLSVFQNDSQLSRNERLAWGQYTKTSCTTDAPAQPH